MNIRYMRISISPLQIVLLFLTLQRSTMYPICISLMNWPTSADGNIYPQLMLMFRLSLVSKWRKFDKLHLGLTSLQSIVFTRVLFYPLLHNVPKWSNFKYLSCKIFKVCLTILGHCALRNRQQITFEKGDGVRQGPENTGSLQKSISSLKCFHSKKYEFKENFHGRKNISFSSFRSIY